ncbi:MAG: FecR domain-containing protein [Verrucomicrobiales bacterium]|nr:FecR domain-containing protein [Verrucomicrobiales bacterium]
MNIPFPSRQFDEAVSAVCHGSVSDEQARALNELLRSDAAARDQYLLRVELHSRLASEPDLFTGMNEAKDAGSLETAVALPESVRGRQFPRRVRARKLNWAIALAACLMLLATGWWGVRQREQGTREGSTSQAVAMLDRVVDAEWSPGDAPPRLGAPLEPGWLRLKAGFAQVVFYSGARLVLQGPAELRLISPDEAICQNGRLIAEVPPQAKGFRVSTPEMNVTDLGTVFGVAVKDLQTALHVFQGSVEFQLSAGARSQSLKEGAGVLVEKSQAPQPIAADRAAFASLFDLQLRSSDAEVLRHEQWRATSSRLDEDPSLLVHFDFEQADPSDWRLPNASRRSETPPDATIVGCQWVEGRWQDKRALAFRNVSDRVRLSMSGDYESLTLAAWVRVQGLDRQINSLFMSDGFEPGTVHWSIRHDGVLGLTAIGAEPGRFQICASPPVLTLDLLGLWVHLAVVIDGGTGQVIHYFDGMPVSAKPLTIKPPFHIGTAELGNWNAQGFPKNDPFMIRNFSGAIDEFCLFRRALSSSEIRGLHAAGKPQPDALPQSRR